MIYRETVDENKPISKATSDFFADFDMYVNMAHFVAKTLHIRPNDILDRWGVPELVVAYGHYSNEITSQNYEEWKNLDTKTRIKTPKPEKYNVQFHGDEE